MSRIGEGALTLPNPNELNATHTPRRGRPASVLETCTARPRSLRLPSRHSQHPRWLPSAPPCHDGHRGDCHAVGAATLSPALQRCPRPWCHGVMAIAYTHPWPWPSLTHPHGQMGRSPRGVRASLPHTPFCNLHTPFSLLLQWSVNLKRC